jgi:hypothetical protein
MLANIKHERASTLKLPVLFFSEWSGNKATSKDELNIFWHFFYAEQLNVRTGFKQIGLL